MEDYSSRRKDLSYTDWIIENNWELVPSDEIRNIRSLQKQVKYLRKKNRNATEHCERLAREAQCWKDMLKDAQNKYKRQLLEKDNTLYGLEINCRTRGSLIESLRKEKSDYVLAYTKLSKKTMKYKAMVFPLIMSLIISLFYLLFYMSISE